MSNLYDIEQLMIERKREIDEHLKHDAIVRHLPENVPARSHIAMPTLRVRFGLLLIRLGGRLAA